MKFSIKGLFSKCDQIRRISYRNQSIDLRTQINGLVSIWYTADLDTFTEQIVNGKLYFLCSVIFLCRTNYRQALQFLTSFYKLKVICFIVNNKPSQSLFWETYLQMWINQWRESQVSKESVGYISVMMFFWCVVVIAGIRLCVKLYKNFVGYLVNSVISDWNIKNNICRTIISLLGFSCKYISRYLGRICRI